MGAVNGSSVAIYFSYAKHLPYFRVTISAVIRVLAARSLISSPQTIKIHAFFKGQLGEKQYVRPTVDCQFQLKCSASHRPNRYGAANHQHENSSFTLVEPRVHIYYFELFPWVKVTKNTEKNDCDSLSRHDVCSAERNNMCKKHYVKHSNHANSCDGVNRYGYRRLKNTEKAGKVFVVNIYEQCYRH